MWRNIACQSVYQLGLLFALLFKGAEWFDVYDMSTKPCFKYSLTKDTTSKFFDGLASCKEAWSFCTVGSSENAANKYLPNTDCLRSDHPVGGGYSINLYKEKNFEKLCLTCAEDDYTHGTIIFNAFIWCQIFNEYTARNILDEWNPFSGITKNVVFFYVSLFSVLSQVLIVEYGGSFTSTSPLTLKDFLYTVALGSFSMIVGVLMRFIPVPEDPSTFFAVEDAEQEVPAAGIEMKPV